MVSLDDGWTKDWAALLERQVDEGIVMASTAISARGNTWKGYTDTFLGMHEVHMGKIYWLLAVRWTTMNLKRLLEFAEHYKKPGRVRYKLLHGTANTEHRMAGQCFLKWNHTNRNRRFLHPVRAELNFVTLEAWPCLYRKVLITCLLHVDIFMKFSHSRGGSLVSIHNLLKTDFCLDKLLYQCRDL